MPYGVTPEMLDAYGGTIFELSLNKQVRVGDPVRALDAAAWRAQRDATGLSDHEIAARVGLALPQVTYIRNVVERRLFRIDQYRKLFRLGGGKRYRADEYSDPEETYAVRPEAMALRAALRFDADAVAGWLASGAWTAETLVERLAMHARSGAARPALLGAGTELSYGELAGRGARLAAALAGLGIRRGDVVALVTGDAAAFVGAYLGIAALGGAALILDPALGPKMRAGRLHHARARAAIVDGARLGGADGVATLASLAPSLGPVVAVGGAPRGTLPFEDLAQGPAPNRPPAAPVAADPLVIVDAGGKRPPRLAPFSHQNVLANARALVARLEIAADDRVAPSVPLHDRLGLVALHLSLFAGAALVSGKANAKSTIVLEAMDDSARARRPRGVRRAVVWSLPEAQAISTGEDRRRLVPLDGVEVRETSGGKVELRGPSIAPGYVDHPAASARRFPGNGWFRAGPA